MRDAHSSNRLKWRHWSIVLAIVLVGITSVSTVWHVDHGVDQEALRAIALASAPLPSSPHLPACLASSLTLRADALRSSRLLSNPLHSALAS